MAPKQWADGPWKLIESPGKTRDPNSHGAIYFANQMAFLHNAFIRGMNSIYIQAPYVRDPADIKDFLFYVKAWCDFLHHHHQIEEDIAFPELEALIGQPGCMSGNVDQHHAFEPRMARLEAYALETKAESYSGARVRELVQDLADELYQHLVDEIPSLLALEKYDGAGMVKIFKKAEKEAMKYPGELAMPMVLGWSDNTFEGGKHIFPEIPGFARYLVRYWYSRAHRGAWRFLPCDNWGMPQPLKFVE